MQTNLQWLEADWRWPGEGGGPRQMEGLPRAQRDSGGEGDAHLRAEVISWACIHVRLVANCTLWIPAISCVAFTSQKSSFQKGCM